MALPKLTPNQIEQIAHIMGDTDRGFKNSEIEHHLTQCRGHAAREAQLAIGHGAEGVVG